MDGLWRNSLFATTMYNSFCKLNPGNHRAVDGLQLLPSFWLQNSRCL